MQAVQTAERTLNTVLARYPAVPAAITALFFMYGAHLAPSLPHQLNSLLQNNLVRVVLLTLLLQVNRYSLMLSLTVAVVLVGVLYFLGPELNLLGKLESQLTGYAKDVTEDVGQFVEGMTTEERNSHLVSVHPPKENSETEVGSNLLKQHGPYLGPQGMGEISGVSSVESAEDYAHTSF